MFPFLSVLCGVIGALALVIGGMTVVGLQTSDQVIVLEHSEVAKKAVYVECRKEGLLLHPERTEIPLEEIDEYEEQFGTVDNAYTRRLAEIESSRDDRYLVLLIRPDGKPAFDAAINIARQRNIDVGFDPVYAAGDIKFEEAPGEEK